MAPIWSFQPFKTVCTVAFLAKGILELSVLSLYYIPKQLRPLPEWGYRLSLTTAALRTLFQYFTAIRYQRPRQLEPGRTGERFVLIDPPRADLFSGVLSPKNAKPEPVGAVWFPAPPQKGARKVVTQFSGGGFVLGWDPNEAGQRVADILADNFEATNTLYVQYRLAGPETHFPAQVQDALIAYNYVLSLGIPPENIFLNGDSAGGNIVLGLLRYLETVQTGLPLPGGAMLWSPWVDVTVDSGKNYNQLPNSRVDFLISSVLDWGARAYIPEGDLLPEAEAFVQPVGHPFLSTTPLFIQAGSHEAFYDAIKSFAGEMSKVEGNQTRFHISELAPHDIFFLHEVLRLKEPVEVALRDACDFFEQLA